MTNPLLFFTKKKNDFFTYSRRKIEKDKEEGRFDAAHNREMTLRCFINFLGKEKLLIAK